MVVIEPSTELGRGVAYATSDPNHLLNVRAADLAAWPDEPDHFTEWARPHIAAEGWSFLPRSLYGAYLQSLVESVERLHARAVRVRPMGGPVEVVLHDGTVFRADRVVLAPGPSPSAWPTHLGGVGPGWVADPWDTEALRQLDPKRPVLLVGTGLTAVDTALSLHSAGHRRIVATSRHGILPATHPDRPQGVLGIQPPTEGGARSLFAWARSTATEAGDWAPVVDALRPHIDELWAAMPNDERARLLRHVHRRWDALRHRMAPSVGARIAAMRDAGELEIIPGRASSSANSRRDSGDFGDVGDIGDIGVEIGPRHLDVGAVINCTGPTPDVRRSRHPLVRSLLDDRVVHPGPLALGLDTDQRGCVPGTSGALWLVGPLRRGRSWETTSIPEIRQQAVTLSRNVWRADEAIGA